MDIGAFISSIIKSPFICVGWIVVGAVAGALARRIMGAKDRPLVNDIILGLVGAIVGGFVAGLFNPSLPTGGIGLVLANLVIATVGAVVLIALGRMIRGR